MEICSFNLSHFGHGGSVAPHIGIGGSPKAYRTLKFQRLQSFYKWWSCVGVLLFYGSDTADNHSARPYNYHIPPPPSTKSIHKYSCILQRVSTTHVAMLAIHILCEKHIHGTTDNLFIFRTLIKFTIKHVCLGMKLVWGELKYIMLMFILAGF